MKKYRALVGFTGIINMECGQIKKLDEKNIHVKDLVKAKLIEEVKPQKAVKKKAAKK